MASLHRYLKLISSHLSHGNGAGLSSLLCLLDPHCHSPWLHTLAKTLQQEIESVELRDPWREIVIEHLSVCFALSNNHITDAYGAQANLVKLFSDDFRTHSQRNWALPVLYTVARDLRLLAKKTDRLRNSTDHVTRYVCLEEAANILNDCFRILSGDVRSDLTNTKRHGLLYICNQLFKIYTYIGRTALCVSLFKAVKSLPEAIWSEFTIAQKVTYNFYAGYTCLLESKTQEGTRLLQFAFERCPKKSRKNKRLIVIFLTLAKMMMGYLPRGGMLKKYKITEYQDIAESIRTGDLPLFHRTLSHYEHVFEEWKVYWLLPKLIPLVHRTLYKRVWCVLERPSGPVSLSLFVSGLKLMMQQDEKEQEEEEVLAATVENYLCELISDNLIKGYISHSHGKVVLSKAGDAFTRLPLAGD